MFLLFTVLLFPRWKNQFTEAPIAWDVSGYYLYLPAIFIYEDLDKLEFLPDIIEKYRPSHALDQAFPVENGNQVLKYPAGMAVLYLPFFLLAHAVANMSDFPADGFSLPYQVAIQLGGALVAILGLFFLRKILIRYFPDSTVGWTVLLLAIGTNFFNYATFDSGNVHVWSFALLAILVHLTVRWHERPSWQGAMGIGACIGLAALVRPTEVIFALVPLLWGITNRESLRAKFSFFKKHSTKLLLAAMLTAAIGFVQLVYWKSVSGDWIVYSYQDQGFSFLKPHFSSVFFSYRKGWFVYTPLMFFALSGFVFLVKKWRQGAAAPYILPVSIFFLVNTWIVASWDIWWYGGAFGQRAMIASYVLLAFPFAALLEWIGKHRWKTWLFTPLFIGCTMLNFFQTYQAHSGPWEAVAMNRAYFWQIFASVEDRPNNKLLLDTNERFSGEKRNKQLIFQSKFEDTTTVNLSSVNKFSGNYSLTISGAEKTSEPIKIPRPEDLTDSHWLNIKSWCFSPDFIPSVWRMPVVAVHYKKEGDVQGQHYFRPHRVLQWWKEWREIDVNLHVPPEDFDTIEIFIWNQPGVGGQLYLDDLKVTMFVGN